MTRKPTAHGAGPLFTRLARAGRFDDIRLLAEYVKARNSAANDNVEPAADMGIDSVMVVRPTVEEIARAGKEGLRFDSTGQLTEWRVAEADGTPRLGRGGKEVWLKPVERYKQPRGGKSNLSEAKADEAEHAERIMSLRGSGAIPPALVLHHVHSSAGTFFERLRAAYEAMVRVGILSRNRDLLRKHGVDGSRTLEQAASAAPRARVARGRTVIARGAGFLAGRTDSSGTAAQGSFVGAPDAAEMAMAAAMDARAAPVNGVLDLALAGKTAREIAAGRGWRGKHGERKAVLELDAAIAELRRAA